MLNKEGKTMKVAVVHDHLGFRGGGQRTVLILASGLELDFITAYSKDDVFPEYQKIIGSRFYSFSKKMFNLRGVRFFSTRYLFWHNRKMLKNYDVIISSVTTEFVAKHARIGSTKMSYTHTPPRRVFDRYEASKKMYPWFLRPAFAVFIYYWKITYLRAISKFDFNIANSNNIRNRIRKYTQRDVNAVVWPPIGTTDFKWLGQDDYFLSWGRVDEAKRIDIIVKAFKKMPHLKLKIASGGPYFDKVNELAKDAPNIEMLGWVEEKQLYELVGKCRAAIYIPIDEDAGMTHLEANAAGKPVLGVAEGGLIETVINGQTGILIKENPNEEDVIKAAELMTSQWCLDRKEICENHARGYDTRVFLEKMEHYIQENDPNIPIIGIDGSRWEDPRYPGEDRNTGVEVYSKNVIRNLIPLIREKGFRVRIYTPKTIDELPIEFQKVIPGKKYWTKKLLAKELKYSPVDYFFTPAYYIPKNAPENSFATIHDVLYRTNKSAYSFLQRIKLEYATSANLKKSKKIITISENSKKEIISEYKVKEDNIFSVPIGYTKKNDLNVPQEKLSYIFYVGRIEKKKSIGLLVNAFAEIKKKFPEWKLVLGGGLGYGSEEIKKTIKDLGLERDVEMLGYISEEKKWKLMTNASIFVHPSSSEGSSIPVFEAWNARTPTIVSNTPVMKEVGGDAVLYFQSEDKDDLVEKISELIQNDNLQKDLVKKGEEKLKHSSWEKTAKEILNVILNK